MPNVIRETENFAALGAKEPTHVIVWIDDLLVRGKQIENDAEQIPPQRKGIVLTKLRTHLQKNDSLLVILAAQKDPASTVIDLRRVGNESDLPPEGPLEWVPDTQEELRAAWDGAKILWVLDVLDHYDGRPGTKRFLRYLRAIIPLVAERGHACMILSDYAESMINSFVDPLIKKSEAFSKAWSCIPSFITTSERAMEEASELIGEFLRVT